ncbi:MAG: lytic transglycosylase domain-containing protein [Burkholderiaceae bacterium]
MVRAESNFDPQAVSPANAQGLMQLLPGTALRFGVIDIRDPSRTSKADWPISGGCWCVTTTMFTEDHRRLQRRRGRRGAPQGCPPFPETRLPTWSASCAFIARPCTTPPHPKLVCCPTNNLHIEPAVTPGGVTNHLAMARAITSSRLALGAKSIGFISCNCLRDSTPGGHRRSLPRRNPRVAAPSAHPPTRRPKPVKIRTKHYNMAALLSPKFAYKSRWCSREHFSCGEPKSPDGATAPS